MLELCNRPREGIFLKNSHISTKPSLSLAGPHEYEAKLGKVDCITLTNFVKFLNIGKFREIGDVRKISMYKKCRPAAGQKWTKSKNLFGLCLFM